MAKKIVDKFKTDNFFLSLFTLNTNLGTGNANRNTKADASGKRRKYQKTFGNAAKQRRR